MKLTSLTLLMLTLLFSSCANLIPVEKASPQKIKIIEQLAKKHAFKSSVKLSSSKLTTRTLKKGQWVASVTTNQKSLEKTLVIRKVVKVTKKEVTFEIETYSSTNENPKSPLVLQQTIKNYPLTYKLNGKTNFTTLLSKLEVTSMKSKQGKEKTQDLTNHPSMNMGNMGLKSLTSNIEIGKVKKTQCKTKYLSSSRCYNVPFSAGIMGFKIKGSHLYNSNIPIIGYISSLTGDDTEEIISYGTKGEKKILIK